MSDLTEIIAEVQVAADTTAARDTDAQITTYVHAAGRQLHSWIAERNPGGVFVRDTTEITTVVDQEAYSLSGLSPEFLKAQRLWYLASADVDPVELMPIENIREFTRDYRWLTRTTTQLQNIRWMIRDFELHLHPKPSEVGTLQFDYTPRYSTSWTTMPSYWPTCARDYMVAYATARVLAREESDPSYWLTIQERAKVACLSEMGTMNTGRPSKIRRQNGLLI